MTEDGDLVIGLGTPGGRAEDLRSLGVDVEKREVYHGPALALERAAVERLQRVLDGGAAHVHLTEIQVEVAEQDHVLVVEPRGLAGALHQPLQESEELALAFFALLALVAVKQVGIDGQELVGAGPGAALDAEGDAVGGANEGQEMGQHERRLLR